MSVDEAHAQIHKVRKLVRWQGLAMGWYVLNCDGASKGNQVQQGGGSFKTIRANLSRLLLQALVIAFLFELKFYHK